MKSALIAIAGVGILAVTAGVETANAQYGSPPPPAYTAPPAYSPAPAYAPSPRYTRRAYRQSTRQTYSAATVYTPGSGPPPYSVSPQAYAGQRSGPWEWYASVGPVRRGSQCVQDVDINRGYGFLKDCPAPQRSAALNPQPLPPRR